MYIEEKWACLFAWLSVLSTSSYATTERYFTLLEPSSARATALGQSFSAVKNDIAGFQYNPATLSTLDSNQFSFLFERQFEQERYSFFSAGIPGPRLSMATSLSYFDTGDVTLYDGEQTLNVVGQRDLVIAAGA